MQWQQQRPLTFCSGRPRPLPVTPDRSPYFHLYRLSLSLPLSQPAAHTQTTHQLNNRTLHPCKWCAEHRVMAACTHYISVHIKHNNTTLKGLSKKDKRHTLYRKRNASTHSGRFTVTMCQLYDNHLTVWPIVFYQHMNIHDGGPVTTVHAHTHADDWHIWLASGNGSDDGASCPL